MNQEIGKFNQILKYIKEKCKGSTGTNSFKCTGVFTGVFTAMAFFLPCLH